LKYGGKTIGSHFFRSTSALNNSFCRSSASRRRSVDNALKFTPEGGAVALDVRIVDGQPLLAVADTGPGIAPAERGAVLQMFYRGHTSERSIPGHGLGLSLVAAIARVHDAAIEILDNEPGCRMQLRFPKPAQARLSA